MSHCTFLRCFSMSLHDWTRSFVRSRVVSRGPFNSVGVLIACLNAAPMAVPAADTGATEVPPASRLAEVMPVFMDPRWTQDGISFSNVVWAATGHRILPLQPSAPADRQLLDKLSAALDAVLTQLRDPNHPAHQERRINEVSGHVERALQEQLNQMAGFECAPPRNAQGRTQRSGYPDLRLVDHDSGRVLYLDPKLYRASTRDSSLRTFYYQPARETNKILDDAHHLIVGIEHEGKVEGHWRFVRWELVDLSHLRVRLKPEFQASNRDLYQPSAIIRSSGGAKTQP